MVDLCGELGVDSPSGELGIDSPSGELGVDSVVLVGDIRERSEERRPAGADPLNTEY